jgi:TetR/AcrR family transcriptional repressor of lmrAB and yxaGH operons
MVKTPMAPATTRERLVSAMASALQRRGLHGVGLNELLAEAQAPKGVLYHHFPGGKGELAVAAIEATVGRLTQSLDRLIAQQGEPLAALGAWIAGAQKQLEGSAFERGCPLATVALESTADDLVIRAALASAFAQLRDRLAQMFNAHGLAAARSHPLATLVVAAYEGALIQARVAGDAAPLRETGQMLLALLQTELSSTAGRAGGPDPR